MTSLSLETRLLIATLRDARAWLATLSAEQGRPDTSDLFRVIANVDTAIAKLSAPPPVSEEKP